MRFHVIDAMYNLLLGTAKNMTKLWCELGFFHPATFKKYSRKLMQSMFPWIEVAYHLILLQVFMVLLLTSGVAGHVLAVVCEGYSNTLHLCNKYQSC